MARDSATQTRQGRIFALLLGLLACLPLRWNHRLGALLGCIFLVFPNRNRRVAQRNLALCFPELGQAERRALLRKNVLETGRGLTELAYFWRRPPDQVLGLVRDTHGLELFEDALAQETGMLLAAPHLGAWELLCQYLAHRGFLTILYREPRDPGVEAVVNAGRGRLGAELVQAGPGGVRRLYRALQEGRIVGILPDQQPKRGNGVFAPFFGIQALTMVLFSRLAARAEGPVIFAYAERLPRGRGFDLHFRAAPAAVRDGDAETAATALNRTVEAMARECPAQYQWGYKRFSIRPEGQPSIY